MRLHPAQLRAALEALSGLNPMSNQVRNIVPSYDIVIENFRAWVSYLSQNGYGTD